MAFLPRLRRQAASNERVAAMNCSQLPIANFRQSVPYLFDAPDVFGKREQNE